MYRQRKERYIEHQAGKAVRLHGLLEENDPAGLVLLVMVALSRVQETLAKRGSEEYSQPSILKTVS